MKLDAGIASNLKGAAAGAAKLEQQGYDGALSFETPNVLVCLGLSLPIE